MATPLTSASVLQIAGWTPLAADRPGRFPGPPVPSQVYGRLMAVRRRSKVAAKARLSVSRNAFGPPVSTP